MEASQDDSPQWVWTTLDGRYDVTSVLGEGGMGAVYLAKDAHSFDREVVIKVPHLAFLGLPGFRQRFQEEVKRLIQLEHPGIVSVYDVGQ